MIYEKYEAKWKEAARVTAPLPAVGDINPEEALREQRAAVVYALDVVDEAFRKDLDREHGLEGHPKEEEVWNFTQEHGRDAEHEEMRYEGMANLLRGIE